jgi:RHS repeat-associated protein
MSILGLRRCASQFATLCSLLLRQGRAVAYAMSCLLLLMVQGNAMAANDAAFTSQTVPAAMTVGETYPITVTMKNTGTLSWTVAGNYFLALQNPSGWNITTIGVVSTIGLNGAKSFTANMTPPTTPGVYNFQWCMSQGGAQFGACSTPVAITVSARAPNAQFVSQNMTAQLTTTTRSISVTMKNTGNTTWKAGQYAMGTQDPQDNTIWTINRLALASTIAPGANGTFTGTITAPAPGYYTMQWRMLETAGSYFGDVTPELTIAVAGGPPTLDIETPTANQAYIGNAGYMDVPIKFTGVPTGVATIKTTQVMVYNPNTLGYDAIATVDGPVLEQTLKRQAANQSLYFKATDSFNKVTMIGKSIVALVDNSVLVSHTVPTTMVPGLQYPVTITFKNNGGTTWDARNVTLAPYNATQITNWGDFSLPLNTSIAPGDSAVFSTTVTPPTTEGSYSFIMRLDESTRSPFGALVNVLVTVAHPPPTVTMSSPVTTTVNDLPTNTTTPVQVAGSATAGTGASISKIEVLDGAAVIATVNSATIDQTFNLPMGTHTIKLRATDNWGKTALSTVATVTVKSNDANFVSQSVTTSMQVGKQYNVSVTMQNSGNKPWTAATGFNLGSENPLNNSVWGVSRVSPTTTVGANGQYTFSFPVTAPATPGTYNFQWRMIQEGWEWFGDLSTNVQVVVKPLAPTVPGLTAPAAGAVFSAVAGKADVRVQGTATAGDGATVSKLEVLDGATVVATFDGSSIDTVVSLVGGAHTLKLRATDNFGQVVTGTVTTAITVQTNNASAISRTVATSMVGGTSYPVTVVMRNSGTTTWTPAAGYALAPVPDNTAWVPAHIPLATTVAPGADATFTFNVTAPQDPATYPFQWRMSQEGKEQFGTQSALVNVLVTGVPPTVTLTAPATGSVFTAANGNAAVTVQGTASATGTATISKFEVLDNGTQRINATGTVMDRTVTLTPGNHVLQLRATDSRGAVTSSLPSTVTVLHNNAALVTQSVPTKMFTGQHYTVSFTVKNTGDTTWQPVSAQTGLGIALAEQPNNGGIWRPNGRVQLANAVAPGENYTFTFDVVAPSTPNNYLFQWRMSDENKELFGALLANLQIPVTTPLIPVATLQSASPENQRVAPGQSGGIQIKGFATETGGLLTKLEVFADNGTGYGAAVFTGGGTPSPLGVLNAVITLPGGSYNLKLRATDSNGNFGDSAPLRVNITDSPLLGQIIGVRTSGAQQLQLVGWACRDTAAEGLSYQVYANAPAALGGTQVASGVANLSGQADDADVQQQCHTPGSSHHFSVDLSALQTQYPGAPLYVSASSTHGESIVLPCADYGCRMPDAMRIGLTSPNANNLDHFRSPSPVFVRAVVTGNTGTVDEVAFNINGEWLPGVSEGAGAYSVSKAGLPSRLAPYIAYAKVRQGEITVITDEHQFYVDPGIVPGEVTPKSGTIVPLNQPTVLSTVIPVTVEAGQSVKFYIDPKAQQVQQQSAPLQRQGGRSLRKQGGATVAAATASTTASSVVGTATFDGTRWSYSWAPTQEGNFDVSAKLLDGAGTVLMQTPTATLTVSIAANPGSPTPVPVSVVVPHAENIDAGTLPGSLGVGAGGEATYSIPLVVPPGTAGLVPELSLNYNSSGTNGVVGLGWSLSGLSSIHRCGKTIAQDNVNRGISFDLTDRLCLDGQRLVRANAPAPADSSTASQDAAYWAANGEYRTEIDSFSRVTALTDRATLAFKVETKDGKVKYYGCDVDANGCTLGNASISYVTVAASRMYPKGDAGKIGKAVSWALSSVVDRSGNHIDIDYILDANSGEHLPLQVRYGGNFTAGQNDYAAVRFSYEPRNDAWTKYIADVRNDMRGRLKSIDTYVGTAGSIGDTSGTSVRSYALAYKYSKTSGRSMLNSVTLCADSSAVALTGQASTHTCLPATTFDWGEPGSTTPAFISVNPGQSWGGGAAGDCENAGASAAPCMQTHGIAANGPSYVGGRTHADYFDFSDFNNDGRPDVLEKRIADMSNGYLAATQPVALTVEDNFSNPQYQHGTLRRSYRYYHNTSGNGFVQYSYQLDSNDFFAVLSVADFDGDGYPDLLVSTNPDNDDAGGGGTGTPKVCLSPLAQGIPSDGMIVFRCTGTIAAVGDNSTGGASTQIGNSGRGAPMVVDVVGDGRAAIYGPTHWNGDVTVAFATLCIQNVCLPDQTNLPPVLANRNIPALFMDSVGMSMTRSSFEQMIDFSGTGKPELAQWTVPSRVSTCVGIDCNDCKPQNPDCYTWLQVAPTVRVNAFTAPGALPPPSLGFVHDNVPADSGISYPPYGFDSPLNMATLAADFNGTGYSGMVYGLGLAGKQGTSPNLVTLQHQFVQCLSTGQHLDCTVRKALSYDIAATGSQYMKPLAVADFDGDGQPDILMIQADTKGSATGDQLQLCHLTGDDTTGGTGAADQNVYCNTWDMPGITPVQLRAAINATGPSYNGDQLYVMDLKGTGRAQLMYYHAGTYTCDCANAQWIEDGRWELFAPTDLAQPSQALDRIHAVTNGIGSTSTVYYTDGLLSGVAGRSDAPTQVYPQRLTPRTGKIVGMLATGNGIKLDRTTSYAYVDAATDLSGRGSVGFAQMVATDNQTGILTTTTYRQAWPFTGMVEKVKVQGNGAVLSETVNTLKEKQLAQASGNLTHFPYIESSEVTRRDWNNADLGKVTTTNQYNDQWGNLSQQDVLAVGGGQIFTSSTVYTYQGVTGNSWLLGLPTLVETTKANAGGSLKRTVGYSYDAKGRLYTEVVEPNKAALRVTTTYDRSGNQFGLVSKKVQAWTDPVDGDTSRVQSDTTFDAQGRFPVLVKNALGHAETRAYDGANGAQVQVVGPNNLPTTWIVDGLGRPVREIRADGNEARTVVKDVRNCGSDCIAGAATVQITESYHSGSGVTGRTGPPRLVYSDNVGHVLRTQSWAFDGRVTVADQGYDNWGRVQDVYQPGFGVSGALATRYDYDPLNRVTATTSLDTHGAPLTSSTEYDGFNVTQINPAQQHRTERRNMLGQVWQVVDAMGHPTGFEYDPFGNLVKTIDPNLNEIKVDYDPLGRKTDLHDPDLGWIHYDVDPLGRVYQQSNPLLRSPQYGTVVKFSYDKLDRMIARLEPELNSYWTYDPAHGIGQLGEAYNGTPDNKTYSRVHTYDSLGRPSTTTQWLTDAAYLSQVEYDDWSRPVRQTYKRGDDAAKVFDLRYNAMGFQSRTERAGRPLSEVLEQDAANRPTKIGLGNGLLQTRIINAYTGRLDNGTLATAANAPRLTEGYEYDQLGSVRKRNLYWDVGGFQESFTYDDLNRLKTSTVLGQSEQLFTYDNAGNLTSKPGLGTYNYPQQGAGSAQPHAVQGFNGVVSFAYDINGNLTSGNNRSASWTTFDMPVTITKGGSSSTFVYGPEHQRTRQDRRDDSILTQVIYAGAQEVEKQNDTVTVKTYWPGGIGVEIDRGTASTELSWMHVDNLGSIVGLTDEQGNFRDKGRLEYDAWGKRRSVDDNASIDDSINGVVDNRGYTGHEMLDQLDLVHMNGRVYDPYTARFLSADPHVTDPANGQSFNRYSYVWGNPTNLTDPTGFDAQVVIWGCGPSCEMAQARAAYAALQEMARQSGRYLVKNPGAVATRVAAKVLTRTAVGVMVLMPGNAGTRDHAGEMGDWRQDSKNGKPLFSPEQISALRKDSDGDKVDPGTSGSGDGAKDGKKDTLQPGPHAGESIPARGPGRDFTKEERDKINGIGQDTGCHTCGSTDPGTTSGNHIPDHQPPNALNPTGGAQELYPHCLTCSRVQGGQVRGVQSRPTGDVN